MILRSLTFAASLTGAAGLSQFPEFSQQYTQRLGGAVDALAEVVADFDASAQAVGLTRQAALDQMTGTEFLDRRQADMTRTFTRYESLRDDLTALQSSGPFMRAYHGARLSDGDIARAAWDDFKPAMPLTFEGIVFGGVGFVLGGLFLSLVIGLLRPIFRRRKRA